MFYSGAHGEIWKGTTTAIQIAVVLQPNGTTQTITLPRGVETLDGIYDSGGLQGIRNQWFSYTRLAPTCPTFGRQLDDIGYFCGVTDLPSTGAQMTVQTTVNEAGALTILFVGTDVNGNRISETKTIPTVAGNSVTTTATFYSITEVVISVTAGELIVTEGTTFFARYQAGETCPKYRRYKFNDKEWDSSVYTICKRGFYALSADNDPMDINNILAFENGLRSYQYEMNTDYAKASQAYGKAVEYLNGELARFEGETSMGTIALDPVTSAGRIWNIL